MYSTVVDVAVITATKKSHEGDEKLFVTPRHYAFPWNVIAIM